MDQPVVNRARMMKSLGWAVASTVVLLLSLQAMAWLQAATLASAPDRTMAIAKIGGAVIAEWGVIAGLLIAFKRADIKSLEYPLLARGRVRGSVLAGLIWVLWVLPITLNPQGDINVLEPSAFNLVGSILSGPGAGVAEEVMFRGLLMSLLAWGGWGIGMRVITTSFLFGLSHAGWGLLSGNIAVGLVALVGTSVLGLVLAGVYIASGRRLLPAAVLHAAVNIVIEPWLVLGAIQGTLVLPGSVG
jgi:membrane protease YdiL (CAAX protease family)